MQNFKERQNMCVTANSYILVPAKKYYYSSTHFVSFLLLCYVYIVVDTSSCGCKDLLTKDQPFSVLGNNYTSCKALLHPSKGYPYYCTLYNFYKQRGGQCCVACQKTSTKLYFAPGNIVKHCQNNSAMLISITFMHSNCTCVSNITADASHTMVLLGPLETNDIQCVKDL